MWIAGIADVILPDPIGKAKQKRKYASILHLIILDWPAAGRDLCCRSLLLCLILTIPTRDTTVGSPQDSTGILQKALEIRMRMLYCTDGRGSAG